MGQVAVGVVGSCSGRVKAQGQRGHPEGILGCSIRPKTPEILLWYRTRWHCVRQLSGQAEGNRASTSTKQEKKIL